MGKHHLLPPTQQYKANLHTHSRVSDGSFTPAEVKEMYKNAGYSILAMTDHNIVADHSELSDREFLMLTGAEYDMSSEEYAQTKGKRGKVYHLNCIYKRPDNLWQPFPMRRIREFSVPYVEKARPENMTREYSLDAINAFIARANEMGCLVTYNHPVWSMQDYTDWSGLKGLWGMEVCNAGSVAGGFSEHNAGVYHTMLRLGMNPVPIAADDMHSKILRSGKADFAQAWCMVCAERLDYDSVITALERGDLYASLGPEIHELTAEDGVVRIRCSPVCSIQLETHFRTQRLVIPGDGAKTVGEAEFDLSEWMQEEQDTPNAFFRLTLTDERGNYAVTRAYRPEELK